MGLRRRGVGRGELLELAERVAEIFDERSGVARAEELQQGAVVPELVLDGLVGEAVPERMALGPVVADDRARVVDLVGERDTQCGLVGDVGRALGRVVKGSFDGSASPCVRDASRHLSARYSIVVVNSGGKVAGPYELGRTKGCPKPAKKAKKHKRHKKHAKS